MNNVIFLALIIPALAFFPYLISEQAYAVKINNVDVRLEVHFNKFDQSNPELETLYDSMDCTLVPVVVGCTLEQGLIDNMVNAPGSPVTGQFTLDDIEADWWASINNFSGENILNWQPEIKEVNIKNGVNFGDLNDIVVDGARPTIANFLNTYGVTEYVWFLYYDEGITCEDSEGNTVTCPT